MSFILKKRTRPIWSILILLVLLFACVSTVSAFEATLTSPINWRNVQNGETISIQISNLAVEDSFRLSMSSSNLKTDGGTFAINDFNMPFQLENPSVTELAADSLNASGLKLVVKRGTTIKSSEKTSPPYVITETNVINKTLYDEIAITGYPEIVGNPIGMDFSVHGKVADAGTSPCTLSFIMNKVNTGSLRILVTDDATGQIKLDRTLYLTGSSLGPLNITANPTNVHVGVPQEVIFTVTDANGNGVSDAAVNLTGAVIKSGTTDEFGLAFIQVNATSDGLITATASKPKYTSGTATVTATNLPVLSVTANPTNVTVGLQQDVVFTVITSPMPGNNTPVSGATVTLTGVATGTGTTNDLGIATIPVTATAAGTVTATATKTGYKEGITTVTAAGATAITVTASPDKVTEQTPTTVTFTAITSAGPVSGATVTLTGVAEGTSTTNDQGIATITVTASSAGTITVTATKTGYIAGTTTITSEAKPVSNYKVGVWRAEGPTGTFYLKDAAPVTYGQNTDEPLTGDWSGSGTDNVGVWRAGTFYLRGYLDEGQPYGLSTDTPLVGHGNAGHRDAPVAWRASDVTFRFMDTGSSLQWGEETDIPLVGDWSGSGVDSVAVFRSIAGQPGTFYFYGDSTPVYFGNYDDTPFVWYDSDAAKDKVGVYRTIPGQPGIFFFKDPVKPDVPYGNFGDAPLYGKWS